jgi:hypothetical protein
MELNHGPLLVTNLHFRLRLPVRPVPPTSMSGFKARYCRYRLSAGQHDARWPWPTPSGPLPPSPLSRAAAHSCCTINNN